MAPVLVCPDCGAKHPIDAVNGSAFPCKGCGRTLKVPDQAKAAVAPPDPTSTTVMPVTPSPAPREPITPPDTAAAAPLAPPRRPVLVQPVPPRWMRFAMWIVAVPLAFLVVFGLAKFIGVLSSAQVENVALDEGWNRYVPIARLLPFVALVTAGFVHGAVYGLTRFRANRLVTRVAATGGDESERVGARASSSPASPAPRPRPQNKPR